MTNTPLKRRQPRFNCFVKKQNESLSFYLFIFVALLAPRTKFKSKDFMGDERKIENEIIIYSVYRCK